MLGLVYTLPLIANFALDALIRAFGNIELLKKMSTELLFWRKPCILSCSSHRVCCAIIFWHKRLFCLYLNVLWHANETSIAMLQINHLCSYANYNKLYWLQCCYVYASPPSSPWTQVMFLKMISIPLHIFCVSSGELFTHFKQIQSKWKCVSYKMTSYT